MRHFNILAAVAATMLAGGVATAKDNQANGEKKVCRAEAAPVGRIPAKRVCRTKAEWDAISAATQRNAARTIETSTHRN